MAGFDIPRAQRQVEDASTVFRGRARAATAGEEATAQLGQSLVGLGRVASELGDREIKRANEEALNRSVDAANQIQQDMVPVIAEESNTAGLDAIGGVTRYDDILEERIQARTADLSDNEKALTRQRLQDPRLRNRTTLATHEVEQRKGVSFSNLDQARDIAIQQSSNNPTVDNINSQLESVTKTINEYRQAGAIDQEDAQDRFTEAREGIITSSVTSATIQDADAGQALLDQTKAVLPADVIKSLEADITKQRKLQKEEIEVARTESVQAFTNETIDLSLEGAATVTQMQNDPRWLEATPSERKDMTSIVKKSDPFNESNPVTLATFTTQVNTAPNTLTKQAFIDAHGEGLSTADFNRLYKQWQDSTGQVKSPRQNAIAQGYKVLEQARQKKVYDSDDPAVNSVEWSRATQTLDLFIEENPTSTPEEITTFVETIISPKERGFVDATFDLFTGKRTIGSTIEEGAERTRAIKLLTEKKLPLTEGNITNVTIQIRDQE